MYASVSNAACNFPHYRCQNSGKRMLEIVVYIAYMPSLPAFFTFNDHDIVLSTQTQIIDIGTIRVGEREQSNCVVDMRCI